MKATLNMGLCRGRHDIPNITDGYVFNRELTSAILTDPEHLEDAAFGGIWGAAYKRHNAGETGFLTAVGMYEYDLCRDMHLNLYVTGLSVALIAVLNTCKDCGVTVTLYHYNRDTNDYFAQEVK